MKIPCHILRSITGINGITNPWIITAMLESLVLIAIAYDLIKTRSVNKVYIWGLLPMVIVHVFRIPVGHSEAWLKIADWLIK